jgi:hypothetical protein
MSANLRELLSELSVETPIGYQRLRIIPLRLRSASGLEYLTLDESCAALVTIEESSPSGTVPELRVRNCAKKRVFIPDGTTLIGAKQNRVVNLSVMVAPESVTVIPVSCVERGRWQSVSPQFAHGAFADSPLRAMMCAAATASLKTAGKVHVNQGAVWSHVEDVLNSAGAEAPTRAYHAVYEKWHQELADSQARLRLPASASGVAAEIDGLLVAVDLFDKPSTLHKLWPKLVRSYLVAALRPEAPRGRKADVKPFLERILGLPGESYMPVGVGVTVRLASGDAIGAALLCDGGLVHLSIFADGMPEPGDAQPPRSAPPGQEPGSEPKRGNGTRPWWRFWA